MESKEPKLMDRVRDRMRTKHYSRNTEKTYVYWILQFIYFHSKRHPAQMGKPEIEAFLIHLARNKRLSPSSQNQAFNAILFLYREVLQVQFPENINALRAKRHKRVPVVLCVDEVKRVIRQLHDPFRLMVELLYGSGLRLNECLGLRIQDVDYSRKTLMVRNGKGKKDRLCTLPHAVMARLQAHTQSVKAIHEQDLERGFGRVVLPHALHRKYLSASREFRWQFLFPQARLFRNPETGERGRWHVHGGLLQKAIRIAAAKAGIVKRVSPHVFLRHTSA